MSSRSGVDTGGDSAKYWVWMKSKPVGDNNENVFYSTNTVSSNKVGVLADEANNWEERAFAVDSAGPLGGFIWPPRSYTCSFCGREFRSAQALGGHMNVHRRDRARLKESDPPIDHHSPNNNSIRRAAVYSSDHSIVSVHPLSSTQEIKDVNDAVETAILLVSPSFAWPPADVHEDNCAQMKEAAGSTQLLTAVCQPADEDKSSSKAHGTENLDDELAKEDSMSGTGSSVSLSSNIGSNRHTRSSTIHRHVSRIGNKRRRRDLPPSLSLSLLMPRDGNTAGLTSSVSDKVNGLDLELRL